MKRINETGAKDLVGFLLYSPIGNRHFFRVHNKDNPVEFTDYKITAEDIQIKLLSNFNSLVEYDDGTKVLDYSSEVLGKGYYLNQKRLEALQKLSDLDQELGLV